MEESLCLKQAVSLLPYSVMQWKAVLSDYGRSVSRRSEINMSSVPLISVCSRVSLVCLTPLRREMDLCERQWSDWLNKWKCKIGFVPNFLQSVSLPVGVKHEPSVCGMGCVCSIPPQTPHWCDRASKQYPVVCPHRGSCLPLHIIPNW